MVKEKAKDKCKCVPGLGLIALILGVVGIYSIILGIKTQFSSALVYNNWMAMLDYVIGIAAIGLAKISKHNAYCKCDMHKMN
jgi:hypothetical protein